MMLIVADDFLDLEMDDLVVLVVVDLILDEWIWEIFLVAFLEEDFEVDLGQNRFLEKI